MAAFPLEARWTGPVQTARQAIPTAQAEASTANSTQAEPSNLTRSSIQMGIGIGVGITVAIIVLILGILWFYFWRREKQKETRPENQAAGSQPRGDFDSFGSTLVTSSRHLSDIPLQDLHEKDGKVVPRRGSEMMTPANSHEVSAAPPTREGRVRIDAARDAAEMPTIWNEGYRGRPSEWIRRDSEMTVQVYLEAPDRETRNSESEDISSRARPGSPSTRSSAEERYTFWID